MNITKQIKQVLHNAQIRYWNSIDKKLIASPLLRRIFPSGICHNVFTIAPLETNANGRGYPPELMEQAIKEFKETHNIKDTIEEVKIDKDTYKSYIVTRVIENKGLPYGARLLMRDIERKI